MSADRLSRAFDRERLRKAGRAAAFVSYSCAGDPDGDTSLEVLKVLEASGVDVLEVGVPFSDPLADGLTNQLAAERALAAGFRMDDVFAIVRQFREGSDAAIVFYTYYNLLFARGVEAYVEEAVAAGVDALLVLDLPPEEAEEYLAVCAAKGMKTVFIVAPTTPEERLPIIAAAASGFIYYVSREGVTGERSEMAAGIGEAVEKIRRHTDLPVVVGFGISTPQQVASVASQADGVVVGSAIVRRIAEGGSREQLIARVGQVARDLVAGCAANAAR